MGQHLLNAKITANIVLIFPVGNTLQDIDKWKTFSNRNWGKHSIGNQYEEKVAGHFWVKSFMRLYSDISQGCSYLKAEWVDSGWLTSTGLELVLITNGRPRSFLIYDLNLFIAWLSDSPRVKRAGIQDRNRDAFHSLFSELPLYI